MKDLLIVRPSKQFSDACPESQEQITQAFKTKFKKQFITVIIFGENETNRTDFEIIKVQ